MPQTDPGDRIYAVGDVHGRRDLLQMMLARIGEHARALPPARSSCLVLVGDLVDRGPESAAVLAQIYDLSRRGGALYLLLGNHEELMMRVLEGDTSALRAWLSLGGAATASSFGLEPYDPASDPHEYVRRFRAAFPEQWLQWLHRCPLSVQSGDYYFVHAGVRPGIALRRQVRTDLLWIREEFLSDERDHGAVIVHGHSISSAPVDRPNRIGLDTGAYRSGLLTGLYLEGEKKEFLSVSLPES